MERGQYFQSNRKTRVYLDAIAALLQKRGLLASLRLAGLHAWIDELPPLNDELTVDFVNLAALNRMLVLIYGPLGGGGVLMRAGRATFRDFYEHWATVIDCHEDVLATESPPVRAQHLLEVLAQNWGLQCNGRAHFSAGNDEVEFRLRIIPCPNCGGEPGELIPGCYSTVGFLQEALEWADLGDFYTVVEPHGGAIDIGDGTGIAGYTFEILKYE